MTVLKLIWAVVRSRGLLLAATVGVCTIISVVYGLLAADRYRAVATLFIDTTALDSGANGRTQARNSDLDLLRSERVAQRVVENERLVEEPALRRVTLDSIDSGRRPVDALGQYVSERVDATGTGEGGVVRVAVTLGDPRLAARVANAYAQAWGEVSLELRSSSIRSGV
ncbi:MAG TPA: hypothetical protein VED85_02065, partial [Burkholderiaceae bacterium]|nr:hypothetical protein [Burkholderiaceae bacterium]